jgi:hypothetical protein
MSLTLEQCRERIAVVIDNSTFDLAEAKASLIEDLMPLIAELLPKEEESLSSKKEAPLQKKALNGYTKFLQENMGKGKLDMTGASVAWKKLTEEEQEVWRSKAKGEAPPEKSKKRLNGFNLYVRYLTTEAEEKVAFTQATKMWKPLPAEEKAIWINKAKSL